MSSRRSNPRAPHSKYSKWNILCVLLISSPIISGCANDKLGADKIDAQDAKGPIPPLKMPPEMQGVKLTPAPKADTKPADPTELNSLDIPLYPGAEASHMGSLGPAVSSSNGITMGEFETKDSMDKVIAFYKTQYPPSEKSSTAHRNRDWVTEKSGEKQTTRITVEDVTQGNGIKTIEISSDNGKTHLSLMRVASGKLEGLTTKPSSPDSVSIPATPSIPPLLPK